MANQLLKTFIEFFLLWIVLYSMIFIINYKRKKVNKYSMEELQDSMLLTKLYLDQFYITNKASTFIKCFLYFCGIVLFFIIMRYIALGQTILLVSTENQVMDSFLYMVSYYAAMFITILLYKTLLDMLFKKEINKLYLYILQFPWSSKYCAIVQFKPLEYMLGCLRIPCYYIGALTYKENMLIFNQDHIHALQVKYLPEKESLIQLSLRAQDLAIRYYLIKKFFSLLAYILRVIHVHLEGISRQMPYFILIMICLIELYNKQLHYIFTASFIFFLIKFKRDLVSYLDKRSNSNDSLLCEYFYKNKIPYAKQRLSFFETDKLAMQNPLLTSQNQGIFRYHKELIKYTFDNFIWDLIRVDNKTTGIYRRFFMLLGFCFITYYFLLNQEQYSIGSFLGLNISVAILSIPLLLLMIYTGYKTHYPVEYEEDPWIAEWEYSRKHNIIFWIAAIIQGYVYWLILLKPQVIIPDSEILFDSIVKITRIYTIEEKIMYIYQYFEHYITHTALTIEEQAELRYKLREIDFKSIIDNTTTLKEIKANVKEFIQTEYYRDTIAFWEDLIERIHSVNPWYSLMRNVWIIGVVSKALQETVVYYSDLFLVLKQMFYDPYAIHIIGRDATANLFRNAPLRIFRSWLPYNLPSYLPSLFDLILQNKLSNVIHIGLGFISISFILLSKPPKNQDLYIEPWNEDSTYVELPEMSTMPLINTYIYVLLVLWFVAIIIIIYKIVTLKRK